MDTRHRSFLLVLQNSERKDENIFTIFNNSNMKINQIILSMIRLFDSLWKKEGLDLRMIHLKCQPINEEVKTKNKNKNKNKNK